MFSVMCIVWWISNLFNLYKFKREVIMWICVMVKSVIMVILLKYV